MNAKLAKLIRAASGWQHGAEYEPPELHRPMKMPAFETYDRTIREMGPVSPGAPTNLRAHKLFGIDPSCPEGYIVDRWIPRSGNRRCVTSHTVEKIRYMTDGKTPKLALLTKDTDPGAVPGAMMPVYHIIPCLKPVHLKAGSPKRVYKELKRLQQRIGLDALYARLEAEALEAEALGAGA